MNAMFSFKLVKDLDGWTEIQMNFPGFREAHACATGDANGKYWEFDLRHIGGVEKHFQIPHTLSRDVLETLFIKAIAEFGPEVLR